MSSKAAKLVEKDGDFDEKRITHNMLEIKRRKTISSHIKALKNLTNCPRDDKRGILAWTVECLEKVQKEMDEIEQKQEVIESASMSHTELITPLPVDYRHMFLNMPHGTVLVSLDGTIQDFNTQFQAILGYGNREGLKGMALQSLTPTEDLPRLYDMMRMIITGSQDEYRFKRRCIREDNIVIVVSVVVTIVRDSEMSPVAFQCMEVSEGIDIGQGSESSVEMVSESEVPSCVVTTIAEIPLIDNGTGDVGAHGLSDIAPVSDLGIASSQSPGVTDSHLKSEHELDYDSYGHLPSESEGLLEPLPSEYEFEARNTALQSALPGVRGANGYDSTFQISNNLTTTLDAGDLNQQLQGDWSCSFLLPSATQE